MGLCGSKTGGTNVGGGMMDQFKNMAFTLIAK